MTYKTSSTFNFDFLHLLKILIIEFGFCLIIYYCYPGLSMLFFGEGANSYMYSVTNGLIYLGLIILPPTVFNFYKAFKHYKDGHFPKLKNYCTTEAVLIIAFIWLLVYRSPMTF